MSQPLPGYLIFGGTGSIGKAVARRLQASGHPVMIAGRNAEKLAHTAAELDSSFSEIDLSNPETFKHAINSAKEQFGTLGGITNCIGSVLLKAAHMTTDDEWIQTLQINLTSSFYILRAAIPAMRSEGGAIVFLSSAAAMTGMANHEAIAAAKGGIIGLTRSAAASYAGSNLRVNAVAPGLVESEMTRRIWENDLSRKASEDMHALGRIGKPDEVASLITWLLLPENSWITGQVIGMDGGLSRVMPRLKHKA